MFHELFTLKTLMTDYQYFNFSGLLVYRIDAADTFIIIVVVFIIIKANFCYRNEIQ